MNGTFSRDFLRAVRRIAPAPLLLANRQRERTIHFQRRKIRGTLPATATSTVWRLTFSAFPIIGASLTSPTRDITVLWETARYNLKPRFLRIPGVARVDLVGGRTPEYHVIADPLR